MFQANKWSYTRYLFDILNVEGVRWFLTWFDRIVNDNLNFPKDSGTKLKEAERIHLIWAMLSQSECGLIWVWPRWSLIWAWAESCWAESCWTELSVSRYERDRVERELSQDRAEPGWAERELSWAKSSWAWDELGPSWARLSWAWADMREIERSVSWARTELSQVELSVSCAERH